MISINIDATAEAREEALKVNNINYKRINKC